MKKRILGLVLAFVLLLSLFPVTVFGATIVDSGTCGEKLKWTLDSNGLLSISGTGAMEESGMFNSPFYGNVNIRTVVVAEGVTTISGAAFWNCSSLTSITLPSSVTSIGSLAFFACSSLKSITFPTGLTTIGGSAFWNCSSLTSIVIPESVTEIGEGAFSSCTSMTSITVSPKSKNFSSDSLGVLFNKDKTTLMQCPGGLKGTYTVPNSVATIDTYAFSDCVALTSIFIPSGVTSIGGDAFDGCSSLTAISVAPENENYFSDSYGALLCNGNLITLMRCPGGIKGSYTIPENVTFFGFFAFDGCSALTNITVPSSVTDIAWGSLEGCSSLTSITVAPENENYSSDANGCLFNKEQTELVRVPSGYTGAYTIPEDINIVDAYAFAFCNKLTAVSFPDSILYIGGGAFYQCTGLTSITLPNKLSGVAEDAFSGCSALTSITIPNSVTYIGFDSFADCLALTSIIIPDSVTQIQDSAFIGCSSLRGVYFCGNAPTIGLNVFSLRSDIAFFPNPNLKLYYIEGKAGWTTPTWNEYPTQKWDPAKPSTLYPDVNQSAWYHEAVDFVLEKGLMGSTSTKAKTFEPNTKVSRAMVAQILYSIAGNGEKVDYKGTFSDVTEGKWFTNAVEWCAKNGLASGSDGKFNPNGNVTRQELAVFLCSLAKHMGIDVSTQADLSAFPDGAKTAFWAEDAVSWAVASKLLSGKGQANGSILLDPVGQASRAELAAVLTSYITNVLER